MPLRGGLSAKIGNRYEGRIAVWRLLQLIDDQHDSVKVRFEEPGDDAFEWWVQRACGSHIYAQVKRQQAADAEWKIGTLVSRGVLPAFGTRLGEDPSAQCEFWSTLSVSHLQDLTESARQAKDLAEFETQFAAAPGKKASWLAVCEAWPGIAPEAAWQRLRRITVGAIDEQTLREALHAHARALVAAPPADVIARLGEFLDDHLCHELTAQDVWDFLRHEAHFEPTDWVRNGSIHVKIQDTTSNYRAGIVRDRAPLAEIHRSAAGDIAKLLTAPDGPYVVTVTADAGMGKTALLGQVLDALDVAAEGAGGRGGPVVLAARLDRLGEFHDAASLGAALGLPESPAVVLSRVAVDRRALLVLDQVDAFGAGSGRNPARLDAVIETLLHARTRGVEVVMACREFDLEVDERLAALAGSTGAGRLADGHHVEHLGPLPPAEVERALHGAGAEPAALTPSLRELLRTPLHLRMFVTLHQHGELDAAAITTRVQLFERFYLRVCHEVERRQANAPVTVITDRLAGLLSERQELSAPAARLGDHPLTVQHLVSAGWLRRDHGRIAFAHEAFFDYAYAQRHVRSGLSLLDMLRSGDQHLFCRGQVRQILALEREQDRDQYLRDVRDVLAAADVRPHIKELVVALVTRVPDPTAGEWHALRVLGEVTSDPLAEHAHALAAQAPEFGRVLLAEGVVAAYLSNAATADVGAWLCQLLVRSHPNEIADLLQPHVGRPGWAPRLARVVNTALLQPGSERVIDLVEAVIDAGDADSAVRGPAGNSDFFSLLHGLNGPRAGWGARLVAAWLRRRLAILVAGRAYGPPPGTAPAAQAAKQPPDEPGEDRAAGGKTAQELAAAVPAALRQRLLQHSMSAPEIFATLAADAPADFARHILPVVRAAAAASRTGRIADDGEHDRAFGMPPSHDPGRDATDALLSRLTQAVRAAAQAGDADTHAAVREMANSGLAVEQALAAAGFAAGHHDLIPSALSWLQNGRYSLAQGWREDPLGLSAAVLAQVCAQLPVQQTQGVQKRAASCTAEFEKRRRDLYGVSANRLLRDIPADRLTPQVRARKAELARKFPPPPTEAPDRQVGRFIDTSIQSPIALEAVQRMNDAQLFNAMRHWSADEWQPLPDGRIRGGASSFAQVVAQAAQNDPPRFIAVLETTPAGLPPIYIRHILRGLGNSTAAPEQLLRAVKASMPHTATCGIEIVHLVERAIPHLDEAALAAAGLPIADLLTLLDQLLTPPPALAVAAAAKADGTTTPAQGATVSEPGWNGPARDRDTLAVPGHKLAETLTIRMWERPERAALHALAILAPRNRSAASRLGQYLEGLAASPSIAARALAIDTAAVAAHQSPDATMSIVAIALNSSGLAHDDDQVPADITMLLASHQLRDLLLNLSQLRYDLVAPILGRMLNAPPTEPAPNRAGSLREVAGQAAQNAAMIAAVAACRQPEAMTLTQTLAAGPVTHRRGIATALAQMLPLTALTGDLITVLTQLFDDPDDDIARLAGTAVLNLPDGDDDFARTILSAACNARTFTLAPTPVITAADHYQGHIPAVVLDLADRFFQIHGQQAADPSGHGMHDASVLGRLVISIYEQETQAPHLAARALNLIDSMILARTYGLEDYMARLDR